MTLNNTNSFIFLSAVLIFSSCKKSDSGSPADSGLSITSISPASGPSATLDTITGKGFTTLDSVFFNGKGAAVVSSSATQLVVKVPPQAGTGKISITVGGKSVSGPVFTFTGNTYMVSTFAGSGNAGYAEGTGKAAGFKSPNSIAIDGNDNLYVSDGGNNRIRKITPTSEVTTFAGSGLVGSVNATGPAASFDDPAGVGIDGDGNLYIADYLNSKIRMITPTGAVTTLAGSSAKGSANGIGTAASFRFPDGIAVDGSGNVFVSDRDNYLIRKITQSGVVSTFAGTGLPGAMDGTVATASFVGLAGITFDAAGNLYVADYPNNNIRKITSDGTVSTIAGGSTDGGYGDGAALSALFQNPFSLAIDGNGFMYVADRGNEVIRQITPDGVVTLLAGTVGSSGTDDGPALKARFNDPEAVAIDGHGNIFVADSKNNTIRKLTPQ